MTDPTKDNFTELEVSKDDYYRALSISKDEDLEMPLQRQPNSCFVDKFFDVGLKAWLANMDIDPVFNKYKAVTCVNISQKLNIQVHRQ